MTDEFDPSEEQEIELPINGELDLHLFRPREVPDLLRDYVHECLEREIFQLRIVHGKGTGQLREMVHRVLEKIADVESFRLDSETGSGWGATLVELKRSTSL